MTNNAKKSSPKKPSPKKPRKKAPAQGHIQTVSEPKKAWDQRTEPPDKESDVAYQAFTEYREMPVPRSLRDVAQKLGKSLTLIGRWSSKHEWVKRIEAWEAYLRTEKEAQRAQQREMLLNDEWGDYETQLAKWNDLFQRTKLHSQPRTETIEGQTVKLVEVNIGDFIALARLRKEIGDQGRRAIGLPEKITQSQLTSDKGGPVEVNNTHVHKIDDFDDLFRQIAEFEKERRDEASAQRRHQSASG